MLDIPLYEFTYTLVAAGGEFPFVRVDGRVGHFNVLRSEVISIMPKNNN